MEDFINCVRSRRKLKYNEDEAFVEAAACIMSARAYMEKQQVCLDPLKQEII